jgi:uncharacterized protein YbjT (DUF2867 family)
MDRSKCSIAVTGATGKQGGAVARALVADGWSVCALVRDPDKPAARALAGLGANLIKGDLSDPDSVARAVDGAYGVYSVQSWADGVDAEERQGSTLAEEAAKAKVEHFVYSSVGCADRHTGVPHFESKACIEQRIHEVGLPFTIFRPVYFMENLLFQRDSICDGHIAPPINPDVSLQLIAVEDIASFVALAFRSPGGWLGHTTELAGDECTFLEIADVFSALLGRSVEVSSVVRPPEPERRIMTHWFEEYGYDADIDLLRTMLPSLHSLPQWTQKSFACTPLET